MKKNSLKLLQLLSSLPLYLVLHLLLLSDFQLLPVPIKPTIIHIPIIIAISFTVLRFEWS